MTSRYHTSVRSAQLLTHFRHYCHTFQLWQLSTLYVRQYILTVRMPYCYTYVPRNNKSPNAYSFTLPLFMSNSCRISTLTFLAVLFFFKSSHYRANLVLWQDALIFSLFLLLVFGPSFMFNDTFSINVFVCDWQVFGNAVIKFPTLTFRWPCTVINSYNKTN